MIIAIVQYRDVPLSMKNPKKQTHTDLIGRVERKKRRARIMNVNQSWKMKWKTR
jgi:hypothetical protein